MMRLRQITALSLLFLLIVSAKATDVNDILLHNKTLAEQWVNWCPSEWSEDEAIKNLANQLLLEAGSRENAPRQIHDWVCEYICYDWDAFYSETYSTLSPSQVLQQRRGVCEAIANLTQALFLEAGIPCIKVWGVTITEGECWDDITLDLKRVNHTWNEFYMGGCWHTIDCTMDLKNSYKNSLYEFAPWGNDFFDPTEAFLSKTHLRLHRGNDFPESSPSVWAQAEIQRAVDQELVSLRILTDYRSPITKAEWLELWGITDSDDEFLTRLDAAMFLSQFVGETSEGIPPYLDTGHCSMKEQNMLMTLYQYKIMTGAGSYFLPDSYITRQEAILVRVRISEWRA